MSIEQAQGSLPENVSGEPLLSVLVLESLLPKCGSEVEDAAVRPARQEAEQVSKVPVWLNTVDLTDRQQRYKSGIDLAGLVIAEKEPVLAAYGFTPKLAFANIVMYRQAAIVEKPPQRQALISRVINSFGNGFRRAR